MYMRDHRDAEDAIRGLDRSVASVSRACVISNFLALKCTGGHLLRSCNYADIAILLQA